MFVQSITVSDCPLHGVMLVVFSPAGQNQVLVGQMPGQGSQGLLMPVSSAGQLPTSVGASLSTNVVPTSAIQSVMTTQVRLLSHDMRFPTMWHFDMCRLGRASAASF